MGAAAEKYPKSEKYFIKNILIVEDQFVEAHDLQLIVEKANYHVTGIARSVDQALHQLQLIKPDLVLVDIRLKGEKNGIELAHILKKLGIGFIFISANSSTPILNEAKVTCPYGYIVKPFREQDILTTLEIAFYRQKHSLESQLLHEFRLKNSITEIINSELNLDEALTAFTQCIQTFIPFDYLEAGFDKQTQYLKTGIIRKNIDSFQLIIPSKLSNIAGISLDELEQSYSKSSVDLHPAIYSAEMLINNFQSNKVREIISHNFGIKSCLVFPLIINGNDQFCLTFYSRNQNIHSDENIGIMFGIESTIEKFISRFYLNEKLLSKVSEDLEPKKNVLKESPQKVIKTEFEGIIGSSSQMASVFNYISKVAPSTDTSVLILGESGTGKEKIAQAIHALSPRSENPLVIVNCGAIPENLAESILFGHEKGAFTGALEKRIGKFELANGGTIFLDEIGEMPLSMQVKLLRVLQEKDIERIGGQHSIKIDVRIIAATNKNLEHEVAAGRFRLDLYYRLHVFPIHVPSLSARKEDIPQLADHFIKMYCAKMNRGTMSLSSSALHQLLQYHWPGNIRELEHIIQRTVLLTDENSIKTIHFNAIGTDIKKDAEVFSIKTIIENERDYIRYILKKCNGKVSGAGGAAEILDINPSTLTSKIKKLEINKDSD